MAGLLARLLHWLGLTPTVPEDQKARQKALEAQHRRIENVSDRVDRILEIQAELIRRES